MNDQLRKQIYANLKFKTDAELSDIWRKQDHNEWTDLALEVVQDILQERNIDPQAPSIHSPQQIQNLSDHTKKNAQKITISAAKDCPKCGSNRATKKSKIVDQKSGKVIAESSTIWWTSSILFIVLSLIPGGLIVTGNTGGLVNLVIFTAIVVFGLNRIIGIANYMRGNIITVQQFKCSACGQEWKLVAKS